MESESLNTNQQVAGSSPAVFSKLPFASVVYWQRQAVCKTVARVAVKVRILPDAPNTTRFRDRLIGRTSGSEPADRGSNPCPEAKLSEPSRVSGRLVSPDIFDFT